MTFVGPAEYRYDSVDGVTMEGFDGEHPEDWLERVAGKKLVWKIKGKNDTYLKPYMDIDSSETFETYPVFSK
jgi:hypothetical protein